MSGQTRHMPSPFLYFADERLSRAELAAARLDGVLVELGDGYIPADAVETRELRASSLRTLARGEIAFTHESAAWVHGFRLTPPARHRVQRAVGHRIPHVIDVRLRYSDLAIPDDDVALIGGVLVTTPARTCADLTREAVAGEHGDQRALRGLFDAHPDLRDAAVEWLEQTKPVHHKRTALAWLRAEASRASAVRTR